MTIQRTISERVILFLVGWLIAAVKLLARFGAASRFLDNTARMSTDHDHQKAVFANYVPTKHDVFVPIYAKSGTNWMLQITQQIAYYGEAEFAHIHDLVSWPDFLLPTTVPLDDPTPQQQAPTGLRIIKSHMASHYLPYSEEAKYILLIRDPKEAFVSGYRFGLGYLLAEEMPSVEWMLERYLSTGYVYGDWVEHTHSYWAWRNRPNVLLMTFNELKQNPREGIVRVAKLMGVDQNDEQLDKVVTKSDVSYMKGLGLAFTSPLPHIPLWGKRATTDLIRNGKSGNSAELLTQAQQDAIDDHMRAELRRVGSDFPYDDLFTTNQSRVS